MSWFVPEKTSSCVNSFGEKLTQWHFHGTSIRSFGLGESREIACDADDDGSMMGQWARRHFLYVETKHVGRFGSVWPSDYIRLSVLSVRPLGLPLDAVPTYWTRLALYVRSATCIPDLKKYSIHFGRTTCYISYLISEEMICSKQQFIARATHIATANC